jgi:predicted nucleic acid-binding protein
LAVIVDTSVWIPALKDKNSLERAEVDRLLGQDQIAMVGIVLAEILRGVTRESEFIRRQEELTAPEFLGLDETSSLLAARILYDLARLGQSIPLADALIAAQAMSGGHSVYTHDNHFSRVPTLKLHEVGK